MDKVLTGVDVKKAEYSDVTSVSSVTPQRTLEVYQQKLNLDFDKFIDYDLYEPVWNYLLKSTMALILPNGIILSFWNEVIRDEKARCSAST